MAPHHGTRWEGECSDFHAPGEEPPVFIRQEVGRGAEQVWKRWRREGITALPLPGIKPRSSSLVSLPIELQIKLRRLHVSTPCGQLLLIGYYGASSR
jgi:hypothetical protein